MTLVRITLSDAAYDQYISRTKSNKKTSRDISNKKMTRNFHLSVPMNKTKDGSGVIYSYGKMRYMVRDNVVVWIENGHRELPMWYKDRAKYNELNKLLGIV